MIFQRNRLAAGVGERDVIDGLVEPVGAGSRVRAGRGRAQQPHVCRDECDQSKCESETCEANHARTSTGPRRRERQRRPHMVIIPRAGEWSFAFTEVSRERAAFSTLQLLLLAEQRVEAALLEVFVGRERLRDASLSHHHE